jgi:hypothetical protein
MPFLSIESLGVRRARDRVSSLDPDLVVVDEAHHARNPATGRYRTLAQLTRRARVLLLTATPVHNSDGDLAALLALFLGARAITLDRDTMMGCVIRRTAGCSSARLPRVAPPRLLTVPDDEARMNAIVALPAPIPPSDGGDAAILLTYSLLRRWASSQGALVASLQRRLARAMALLESLAVGRYPSSRELSAWAHADGVVQLAFPELMIDASVAAAPASSLAEAIAAHSAAVRALLADLRGARNVDEHRANHLRAVRAGHPGAKIVAFTQYAETVGALFTLLRHEPAVAALTSTGAQVAGGALTRAEALARFAPAAQGTRATRRAETIDLLLTTDLLSEGVNLQDASVVVHLDLPWTPARLEQRVGRAARIGSPHERVMVYAMQPPASAERLVRVEERLRAKLCATARSVGIAGTILPPLTLREGSSPVPSGPEWRERLGAAVAHWREENPTATGAPIVAAVRAELNGFIAIILDAGVPHVIASTGGEVSDDVETLLGLLKRADGPKVEVDPAARDHAVAALVRWRASRADRRDITLDGALRARARRAVVDRIAAITRRAPRHLRPVISALAATARHTAGARYGAGAERVLDELATADLPDEAWLRAIGTFGALHTHPGPASTQNADGEWIRALLLLVAPSSGET